MAINIIKPGMFTTIQDLGRIGYRSVGIGPGGAMDFFAASAANILAGDNNQQCAVIEMHFPAAEILFEKAATVCITGGDFSPHINDAPAGLWKPLFIKKNERLSFKKYINGARAYIAISGGIKADNWLNSFSTRTRLKAGGHQGRPLLKEDTIPLNETTAPMPVDNFPDFSAMIGKVYSPSNMLRCIAGPEWELLNEESKKIFPRLPFSVTAQSDRMGYRLQGIDLALREPVQLVSSPVDAGTIQLLPNGQLIVLMADHQTTGGYPRIANVITADLPKLAQSHIHSNLHFELVNIETAEEALLSLYQTLYLLRNDCDKIYNAHRH